jgi:nucleoside-diphosphate-sugar epimerase
MPRRVLVTGAGGFVARHALAPLAASGAEVHAVTRGGDARDDGHLRWHRADLLERDARRSLIRELRPDVVLHCAWVTGHGRFWTAPDNLDWSAATLDLVREACECGLGRFVGVGTCFEYPGDTAGPCNELTTRPKPRTLYAVAKDACRRILVEFGPGTGLSFAWARLFLLYGPGEHPARLVPDVARALVDGRPARIGSGRAVRDFMDTRDAGAALAALTLSSVEGAVNVASGEAVSVRTVAETLARLAGEPGHVEIGALPDRDEPAYLVADVGRLRGEVGFDAVRPLEQGLSEALEYWRNMPADWPAAGKDDR